MSGQLTLGVGLDSRSDSISTLMRADSMVAMPVTCDSFTHASPS